MDSNIVVNRQLGKNGPTVPALGLGLMGMSFWVYGSIPSDEERFKVLDRAVELGETFWDTSEYVSAASITWTMMLITSTT